MAPTKPSGGSKGGPKGGPKRSGGGKSSSSFSKPKAKPAKSSKPVGVTKPSERKTKRPDLTNKKKKRVYTDKELNIPALNGIKPAGIEKPHGVKKGKKFVDDRESMMAILALVQAEREGNIESKMMRARQMEEIRQARTAEMEKKEEVRKKKLEGVKDEIRKEKKGKKADKKPFREEKGMGEVPEKRRKKVSFG